MQKYDIAAYIWPSYTGKEFRARQFWPDGMGEWQTVMSVPSRMPLKPADYEWDRKPLWGCCDEADPKVMEMQIEEAVKYGVNVFIYDWYWYDRRPFLEQCLDEGFLGASNNEKMKFYIMWANHDAGYTWDTRLSDLLWRGQDPTVWLGSVDRHEFEIVAHRIIEKYFSRPNYYKINGKPLFMIYDVDNLVKGLGGMEATRDALEWFRAETVKAGHPGLELQLTGWGERMNNMSGVDGNKFLSTKEVVPALGFDSVTNYQFVHFCNMNRDYADILPEVYAEWERMDRDYTVPFYPHVSIGWDNNPRFRGFVPNVCTNNTPEMFEQALRRAKEYVDTHNLPVPLITINSWNEWTETSYLEPDTKYGYGYLEAVKRALNEETEAKNVKPDPVRATPDAQPEKSQPDSKKKRKWKLFAGLAAILAVILAVVVGVFFRGDVPSMFEYIERPDGTYSVRAGVLLTDATTAEIPDSYLGKPVTAIEPRGFAELLHLQSVTIPDSVTSIGNSAFSHCTSLTSIEIPDGVTSIDRYAFYGCTGLTSIVIPDGVTSIGNSAFYHCTSLTSIEIPDSVTSIDSYVFGHCTRLISIEIPDSVTSIGSHAFYCCTGLTSIEIPDSVTHIGDFAFFSCSGLISIRIPDSVISLGDSAFYSCSALFSVRISENVTSLGQNVFRNCTALDHIKIPESVTSIGEKAFFDCTDLSSIVIPNRVTYIGQDAFWNCTRLTQVQYTGTETEWEAIDIARFNYALTSATIHYNYVPD